MESMMSKGFTIIELLIVIIIIGSLAAAAIVSLSRQSSIDLFAQRDQIAQDIRYTQTLAMTQSNPTGGRYRILFGTTSYTISQYASSAWTAIKTENLTSGITFTSNNFTNGYVAFDSLGQPHNGTTNSTLMTGTVTVSITDGVNTRTISVIENTGSVEVS